MTHDVPDQSTPDRCAECGAPIPPDAPAGACPGCLIEAAVDPEPDPAIPSTGTLSGLFPELQLRSLIGRGGMGAVFKAKQTSLDRFVALKVLLPQEGARGEAFADRFGREARALARLDHPHIVRVYEFGEREGIYFLVMEYVDGVNLREAMEDGEVTPRQALAIIPQVCDALQFAHDNGVVHRDIKPENVLLTREGAVKVADFGLAKLVAGATEDATLTRAGQVMGTVHYMAPEQVDSPASVDHRADIYSLGVVFYEMLTGELPIGRFEAPSHRAQVDARLDEVVLRALERKRERRFQRADDVKTAISGIDDPGSGGPVRARPAAATADRPADPRPSIPAMLSLVSLPAALVVVAIALFAFFDGGDPYGIATIAGAAIGLLAFVGFALGVAGFLDTRGGAKSGRWMAIVGALVGPACAFTLIPSLYYGMEVQRRQADRRSQELAAERQRNSLRARGLAEDTEAFSDPEFRVTSSDSRPVSAGTGAALKARLTYLLGAAARNVGTYPGPAIEALVGAAAAEELAAHPDRDGAAKRGELGLAVLAADTLPYPLEEFRLVSAHLATPDWGATKGLSTAVARCRDVDLTFSFQHDYGLGSWALTTEPLGWTRTADAATDSPPVRVFDFDGDTVRKGETSAAAQQIEMLYADWASHAFDAEKARSFYHHSDQADLAAADAPGLPFSPRFRDHPARQRMRIVEIRFLTFQANSALVTLESTDGRVVFPVRAEAEGWFFAPGRVLIEWNEGTDGR